MHAWFYKGYHGWWKYDARTNSIIENEYKKDIKKFEILIAGRMYIIDLGKNIQSQVENPKKKRVIKRDLNNQSLDYKGVAGILYKQNESV